jgi:fido (protein-threonine AMPylation protein)
VEPRRPDFSTFKIFADHEESPFYRAGAKTPEETWDEVHTCGVGAINDVRARVEAGAVPVEPELIAHWHRLIFHTTFPADAGRFRWKREDGKWEDVFFGVSVGTAQTRRRRPAKGAHPNRIRTRLDVICEQFNRHVAEAHAAEIATLGSSTAASARLYARVLNVHPFVDGNLRAAFVTLQYALRVLDLPMVEFPDIPEHNDALDLALRIDRHQTYDPLGSLLERIIREGAQYGA